jgi:hypothetical protein
METPWGTITPIGDETEISATFVQLDYWANRPGREWPCSTMRRPGWARFASNGDLVGLSPIWYRSDIDGAELTAWADDVRKYADAHR